MKQHFRSKQKDKSEVYLTAQWQKAVREHKALGIGITDKKTRLVRKAVFTCYFCDDCKLRSSPGRVYAHCKSKHKRQKLSEYKIVEAGLLLQANSEK